MIDFELLPTIWAYHRTPRTAEPTLIVVHDMEAAETDGTARGAGLFFQQQSTIASTQLGIDAGGIWRYARDNEICNGAGGGVNSFAVHVELAGRAAQTVREWDDATSRTIRRFAEEVIATWLTIHPGIQFRKLSGEDMAAAVRAGEQPNGICGHVDVTSMATILGRSTAGHWDPGPNFPWSTTMANVAAILAPTPPAPTPPTKGPRMICIIDDGHSAEWHPDATPIVRVSPGDNTVLQALWCKPWDEHAHPNVTTNAWGQTWKTAPIDDIRPTLAGNGVLVVHVDGSQGVASVPQGTTVR